MPGSDHNSDYTFKTAADALTVATRPESAAERLKALRFLLSRTDARHTGFVAAYEVARSSIDQLDLETKGVIIELLSRGHEKQLSDLRDESGSKSSPFDPLDILHFAALSSLEPVVSEWVESIQSTSPPKRLDAVAKIFTAAKGALTPAQASIVAAYLVTRYSRDATGADEADGAVLSAVQRFLVKHGSSEVFLKVLEVTENGIDAGIEIIIWNTVAKHGGKELAPRCEKIFATDPLRFINCLDESMPKQLAADCRKVLRHLSIAPSTDPEVLAIVVETFTAWFEHLSRSEKMTTTEVFSSLLDRVSESERLGRALADFFMEAPDGKSITSQATEILTPPEKPNRGVWGALSSVFNRAGNSDVILEGPTSAAIEFAVRMLENFDEPFRHQTYQTALTAKNANGSAWLSHESAVLVALALGPADIGTRRVIQALDPNVIPDWHDERFASFVDFAAGMPIDSSLALLVPVSELLVTAGPGRLSLVFSNYFVIQWAHCAGTPSEQKLIVRAIFELADRCPHDQEIANRIIVPFYRQMRSAPFEIRTLLRARYDANKETAKSSPVLSAELKEIVRLLSEETMAKAL